MEERRKSPRIKYPCTIVLVDQKDKAEMVIPAENLSAYGTRVALTKKMDINSSVQIILEIDDKRIQANGRIVWVVQSGSPQEDAARFDTGIEFLNLSFPDKEFITQLIERESENA